MDTPNAAAITVLVERGFPGLCRAVLAVREIRQADVARRLGLSEPRLSMYLRGRCPMPPAVIDALQRELCLDGDLVLCTVDARSLAMSPACRERADAENEPPAVRS